MTTRTRENWTPQANQWNGSDPSAAAFEGRFDLSETPPMGLDAELALGSMEQVLSWRGEDENTHLEPRVDQAARVDPANLIG